MADFGGVDDPGVNARHAELYREAQARRLMRCFEQSVGAPAASVHALLEWYADHQDEVPLDEKGKLVPLCDEEDA